MSAAVEFARGRTPGRFEITSLRIDRSAFRIREWLEDGTAVASRSEGGKTYRIQRVAGEANAWRIVERLTIRPDGAAWRVVS